MTYRPQWQDVQRFAYRFAADNHWRVRHVLDDLEDCVQEAAAIYCLCVKIYGDTVDERKWFFTLYSRALARHFHSLARVNRRRAAALEAARDIYPAQEEPTYLYATLVEASRELQAVLKMIALAPRDLLDLLLPTPQARFSRETEMRISRSWCRLARVNVREDLVTELRGILA